MDFFNGEHYKDPTAAFAVSNVMKEDAERRDKLLFVLHYIAKGAGYTITNIKLERRWK